MQYAPREPSRIIMAVLDRLWAANHSDTCIVSGEKIRELCGKWFGSHISIRTVWYHLYAAKREHLIIRQTRWRAVGGKLVLKARTRYRCGWRHLQRQLYGARQGLRLAALVTNVARRETVQKIALGLQNILSSVVPLRV